MSKIFEAKKLAIGYKTSLQKNLDFAIWRGSFACLMGKNGCGKSTLLKTLGGLLRPVGGEILIEDTSYKFFSTQEMSRKIAMVLTQKVILENRSVYDVLALGRTPYVGIWGKLDERSKKVIEEVADCFSLTNLLNSCFDQLSDGQKQKVVIARAFVQEAELVILDEPTTYLDVRQRYEVMLQIKKLAREKNIAVLFSSHDWELALEICDTVWLMDDGLRIALPEELILDGSIDRSFSGEQSKIDMQKGGFAPDYPIRSQVALSGDDCHSVRWTKHALKKIGIGVSNRAPIKISAMACHWSSDDSIQKVNFESLQELIDHLSKSFGE